MNDYVVIDNTPLRCGECPMWDVREGLFYWSDMLAGKIFRFDPRSEEIKVVSEGRNVSGFVMNDSGGFVCATHQGVYLYSFEHGWRLIADEFAGQKLHCNDATADERGRFLFGTTFYDQTVGGEYPLGKLYSVASDGAISILDEGWHLTNGIGFSPDQKTMYATDTVTREIIAFDYDVEKGSISNKRVFVKVPDNEGIPDGLTVDSEGYVWSAQWYGYRIVRYDPTGNVVLKVHVPSGQTSSLVFGGDDLSDIYVTSAAEVIRLAVAPVGYDFEAKHSGSTYRFNKGIKGMPEHYANISLI